MPNENTKAHVYVRDKFCCRHCGRRTFLGPPIKLLDIYAPDLQLWDPHGKKEPLRLRWATLDHLTPQSLGGRDECENLVTCCVECNSRRPLESASAPPSPKGDDDWFGLADVFLALQVRYKDRLTSTDRKWAVGLLHAGVPTRPERIDQAVSLLRDLKAGNPPRELS